MKPTEEQQKIIQAEGSSTVLGAPGTGKTTTLVEKIAYLIESSVSPAEIYVGAFAYRSMLHLKYLMHQRLGDVAKKINVGTFRDFAMEAIQSKEKEPLKIANHAIIRRFLRQAMAESDFEGTVVEAEHILRMFKAKARKPSENERHFQLLASFRALMDAEEYTDRYDIIRKHIVGIRNDVYQPCQIKHLLVDNIQDATQIQFLWLFEHLKAGTTLTAFGDDDLCVFARDGAVGEATFQELEEQQEIKRHTLTKNFMMPEDLGISMKKFIARVPGRLEKKWSFSNKTPISLSVTEFDSIEHELKTLVKEVGAITQKNKEKAVVLVRNDFQARRVDWYMKQAGLKPTCIAPALWDAPGAIMVLDFLEVLLNTANDVQLRNVLIGFGLSRSLVDALFGSGMIAQNWLKKGAPLPDGVDLPNATLREYGALQRTITGYYQLMAAGQAGPRDVFKAACYDLVKLMNEEDRRDALVALETLLSLKGKLAQLIPEVRKFVQPNFLSQVVVSPIREVRNLHFEHVFMPFAVKTVYPYQGNTVLPYDEGHEKRVFYMALSRAVQGLYFSASQEVSPFVQEIEAHLQQKAA